MSLNWTFASATTTARSGAYLHLHISLLPDFKPSFRCVDITLGTQISLALLCNQFAHRDYARHLVILFTNHAHYDSLPEHT